MASVTPGDAANNSNNSNGNRGWFRTPDRVTDDENRAPEHLPEKTEADKFFKIVKRRNSIVAQEQKHWDIGIYVNVLQVRNIDTVENTFEAFFFLRLMWVEEGASQKDPDDWFDPKIHFVNQVEEPTPFNAVKRICEWRTGPNGEDVVEARSDYSGVFRDTFDLHNFPFDSQFLTICVTTNMYQLPTWPNKFGDHTVRFFHDHCKSKYGQDFIRLTSWRIFTEPFVDVLNEEKQKFSIMYIDVLTTRRWDYYVYNVMVPVFLVSALGCMVYGVPREDLADRLSVTLALLLTNVAYKITVADSLPKLGYNTYLDYYTLVNFSFLVFLSIENLIVGRHHEDDWSEETDEWCLFALLVVYVLISVGFIGRAVYIVHKDPLQLQTLKTRDIG